MNEDDLRNKWASAGEFGELGQCAYAVSMAADAIIAIADNEVADGDLAARLNGVAGVLAKTGRRIVELSK